MADPAEQATDAGMPELPEPTWAMPKKMPGGPWSIPGAWSADQMRDYGLACALAERERCAKLCESLPLEAYCTPTAFKMLTVWRETVAAAIRKGE